MSEAILISRTDDVAAAAAHDRAVYLSVVIPVFNEEASLPALFARLYPVLDGLGYPYEILFTNDGSVDRSGELLAQQHALRRRETRVIEFNANYGQQMAVMAGFERARGQVIVTLDADLQNPPEEIPKLLTKIAAGYDCVGGYRIDRQDTAFRRYASRLVNFIRQKTTNIEMTDHGCMLRAYTRAVTLAVVRSGASNTMIPPLAYSFASRPTEVPVRHEKRHGGHSTYSLGRLVRLNFDLITGFSIAPLQWFTMFGLACAGSSVLFLLFLAARSLLGGTAGSGLVALFGVLFFLLSVAIVGIGLVGEYAGRTYQALRNRQRYVVSRVLEALE
ncbi:MAG TPA: glycosyltransferase [Opitutaceae bacterium]